MHGAEAPVASCIGHMSDNTFEQLGIFHQASQTGVVLPIDATADAFVIDSQNALRDAETHTQQIPAGSALHFLESLKYLARESSGAGRETHIINELEAGALSVVGLAKRTGERTDDSRVQRERALRTKLTGKALMEFSEAVGRNSMIDKGGEPEEVDAKIEVLFEDFKQRYLGANDNARLRTNFMNRLRRVIEKDSNVSIGPRGLKRLYLKPAYNERIVLDENKLFDVGIFMDKAYKSPLRDEVTGAYNLKPTDEGVEQYVQSELEAEAEDPEKPDRQREHIAESAEFATGLFYGVARFRKLVLEAALQGIATPGIEKPRFPAYLEPYVADAISDLGYCMRNNVDNIPISKFKGQERHIERFGVRATEQPFKLHTADGILLMNLALDEQERRMRYWKPRYDAVVRVFGTQIPAEAFDISQVENYDVSELARAA